VRPRPDAPVATPLEWDELDDANTTADRWTLATVPARLAREGDPWRAIRGGGQSLASASTALDAALAEAKGAGASR
jgi:bifunctional non-homologous end joining protein LigD